jgi:hypothetical protein
VTARADEVASDALLGGNGDTVRNGTCVDRSGAKREGVAAETEDADGEAREEGEELELELQPEPEPEPVSAVIPEGVVVPLEMCTDGTKAGESGRRGVVKDEDDDEDLDDGVEMGDAELVTARLGVETQAEHDEDWDGGEETTAAGGIRTNGTGTVELDCCGVNGTNRNEELAPVEIEEAVAAAPAVGECADDRGALSAE